MWRHHRLTHRPMLALALSVSMGVWAGACGNNDPQLPNAPSDTAPVLRSIAVSPSGTGLERATQFTFSADTNATTPQGTFEWQFGDGSSTTGGSSASHVFASAGSFTVQVTVRNAAGQASASSVVQVASLVGTWVATVTGHTNYPSARPIPITSVELRLMQSPPGAEPRVLDAIWRDDAGCRAGTGYPDPVLGSVSHPRAVSIGVDNLFCNGGALYLNGTADEALRVISGACSLGGPDCRFVMVRQ